MNTIKINVQDSGITGAGWRILIIGMFKGKTHKLSLIDISQPYQSLTYTVIAQNDTLIG